PRCPHLHTPAPTAISTLPLRDALPIFSASRNATGRQPVEFPGRPGEAPDRVRGAHVVRKVRSAAASIARRFFAGRVLRSCTRRQDRKSTRLNSSHVSISYAVFCLKKKI